MKNPAWQTIQWKVWKTNLVRLKEEYLSWQTRFLNVLANQKEKEKGKNPQI